MRNLLLAVALAAIVAIVGDVTAQPTRTVRIVVPLAPGGSADVLARLLAEQVGRQGPAMVVENRPGGGTVIGTEAVSRAVPDGSTVLTIGYSFIINPHLRKLNYDPLTNFEPICYTAGSSMGIVVNVASPYRTLGDLFNAARSKPGELTLATAGAATTQHIAFEVLKRAANINMTHVPYPGGAPAINALLGGHVAAMLTDYPTAMAQLTAIGSVLH